MTTFDLVHIQEFVANLDARMGPDLHGARDDPTALAIAFRDHAELCREFTEKVRDWRYAIFSGRIEFDPAVESVILAESRQLIARADELQGSQTPKQPIGPTPDGLREFRAAVEPMRHLFQGWFPPKLAVGPGPRSWQHQTEEMIEEGRRRIANLPRLPADWLPSDPDQLARFLKLHGS